MDDAGDSPQFVFARKSGGSNNGKPANGLEVIAEDNGEIKVKSEVDEDGAETGEKEDGKLSIKRRTEKTEKSISNQARTSFRMTSRMRK